MKLKGFSFFCGTILVRFSKQKRLTFPNSLKMSQFCKFPSFNFLKTQRTSWKFPVFQFASVKPKGRSWNLLLKTERPGILLILKISSSSLWYPARIRAVLLLEISSSSFLFNQIQWWKFSGQKIETFLIFWGISVLFRVSVGPLKIVEFLALLNTSAP